jgi:hypothetical protein
MLFLMWQHLEIHCSPAQCRLAYPCLGRLLRSTLRLSHKLLVCINAYLQVGRWAVSSRHCVHRSRGQQQLCRSMARLMARRMLAGPLRVVAPSSFQQHQLLLRLRVVSVALLQPVVSRSWLSFAPLAVQQQWWEEGGSSAVNAGAGMQHHPRC